MPTSVDYLIPSPGRVIRGTRILSAVAYDPLGSRLLIIGGKTSLPLVQPVLAPALGQAATLWTVYGSDCSDTELERLQQLGHQQQTTGVIGIGGGKALDTAKLIAHRLSCPIFTIPTSAATCAAWTALSNIYSPQGAFQRDVPLPLAPAALILDYEWIRQAPPRTLRAGIGDALAKWYEASVSSGSSSDALVIAAVQQARVLRDLLLQQSAEALADPYSIAWQQVVDACICLAGVVGGLGGAKCRTVAAHAVHNGLTHLLSHRSSLHGEKVAFGILVQLRLEEILQGSQLALAARKQLLPFYREIGLPTSLADLQLPNLSSSELMTVAQVACVPSSDLHHLPFAVIPEALVVALMTTTVNSASTSDLTRASLG